ncbi:hypothetical protein [Mesonia aquimarina]|uniref:hypothetical protein n=1 Tax=Mesonia aquimarina TaxID=1504967 RepID=UPI000EF58D8A|nr:hypothetical protein [Mesonia aquimarina]
MNKYLIIALVFTSVTLLSCNNSEKSSEKKYESAMTHVLEVHDEVMPEMTKLNNLISKLQEKIDTSDTKEKAKLYQNAMNDLKGAHAFMMEWMRDFAEKFPNALKEPNYTEKEYEEKLNTLEAEEKEVKEMKRRVNNSIKEAEKLLAE